MFWGLRLFVSGSPLPAQAQLPGRHLALNGDLHRLLGGSAATAAEGEDDEDLGAAGDRFKLLGVVAPRGAEHSPQGVALIAVGDQPARPWHTGAVVDGETVLLAVSRRSAQLGPRGGPPTTELTLPEPTRSAAAPPAAPGLPRSFGVPQPGQPQLQGARPMGQPTPMLPNGRPVGATKPATPDDDEDE